MRFASAVLTALLLGSCTSGPEPWLPSWGAPYGDLELEARAVLALVRGHLDAGEVLQAQELLEPLARRDPDNLDLAVLLQDTERLLALERERDPDAVSEQLRTRYAQRALARPSAASKVLAARAETDAIAAQVLLEEAVQLDPTCAWAHYGLAHARLRQTTRYRWREARSALQRALAADPGHVRARRLEAWMLGQEGVGGARAALRRWLEATASDPRVSHPERVEAQVDLALEELRAGRARSALRVLDGLEGESVARPRRLAARAVALHELGDMGGALDAAVRAREADPQLLLPRVQEALVVEFAVQDPDAADERWRSVVAHAEDGGELADLLQVLRARVLLERREEARREAAALGSDLRSPVEPGGDR